MLVNFDEKDYFFFCRNDVVIVTKITHFTEMQILQHVFWIFLEFFNNKFFLSVYAIFLAS